MLSKIQSEENYKITGILGSGSYGVVAKIKIKSNNEIRALKQIDLKKLEEYERSDALEEVKKEFNLLEKNLKNVVRGHECHYDNTKMIFKFTMDLFPMNLSEFLEKRYQESIGDLKFEVILPIFENIITGLRSLYNEKVIHRDLKPENILISEGGEAFIADVGVAKYFENTQIFKQKQVNNTFVGTESWMAPEMKNSTNGTKIDQGKLDIFSLGLIILFCLDKKNFPAKKQLNENSMFLHEEYLPKLRNSSNIKSPANKSLKIPKGIYYLLKCMLSFDWSLRPSIEELDDSIKRFAKSIKKKKLMKQRLADSENQIKELKLQLQSLENNNPQKNEEPLKLENKLSVDQKALPQSSLPLRGVQKSINPVKYNIEINENNHQLIKNQSEKEFETIFQKLKELESSNEKYKEMNKILEIKIRDSDLKLNKIKKNNDKINKEAELQAINFTKRIDSFENEITSLRASLNFKIKELDDAQSLYKTELNEQKTQYDDYIEENLKKSNKLMMEKENELKKLKQQISKLENDLKSSKNSEKEISEKVKNLQLKLKLSETKINLLITEKENVNLVNKMNLLETQEFFTPKNNGPHRAKIPVQSEIIKDTNFHSENNFGRLSTESSKTQNNYHIDKDLQYKRVDSDYMSKSLSTRSLTTNVENEYLLNKTERLDFDCIHFSQKKIAKGAGRTLNDAPKNEGQLQSKNSFGKTPPIKNNSINEKDNGQISFHLKAKSTNLASYPIDESQYSQYNINSERVLTKGPQVSQKLPQGIFSKLKQTVGTDSLYKTVSSRGNYSNNFYLDQKTYY